MHLLIFHSLLLLHFVLMLLIDSFKDLFILLGRQIYREKETQRKNLHPLVHSPSGCQWTKLRWFKAMRFFQVSLMGAVSQGFRSSSSAFSGHKQRAGRELEQMVTNQHSYRISAHARWGLEPLGYTARPTMDSLRLSPFCEGKNLPPLGLSGSEVRSKKFLLSSKWLQGPNAIFYRIFRLQARS